MFSVLKPDQVESHISGYYRLLQVPSGCHIYKYHSRYQDIILFSSLSKEYGIEQIECQLYRASMSCSEHNRLTNTWINDIYSSIYISPKQQTLI